MARGSHPGGTPIDRLNRWLYRGGRPGAIAAALNRLSARLYRSGRTPSILDTLEVTGRSSGRTITLPVVIAELGGERYLVSMLGETTSWVKNVRAAGGHATLLKGGRTAVHLHELPAADRAPVIKRYCEVAPGGRSHIPVDRHAPIDDFQAIAVTIPVFRIDPREPAPRPA